MNNLFAGLGSRVEPQKLDDLCDQAVTCKALEAVSGLSNAIVKMALSNLTTEHLTKKGNQWPARRYVLSKDGIERFKEETKKILTEKRSPKEAKTSQR